MQSRATILGAFVVIFLNAGHVASNTGLSIAFRGSAVPACWKVTPWTRQTRMAKRVTSKLSCISFYYISLIFLYFIKSYFLYSVNSRITYHLFGKMHFLQVLLESIFFYWENTVIIRIWSVFSFLFESKKYYWALLFWFNWLIVNFTRYLLSCSWSISIV